MFASNHCSHLIAILNWGVACQIPQTPYAETVGFKVSVTLYGRVAEI